MAKWGNWGCSKVGTAAKWGLQQSGDCSKVGTAAKWGLQLVTGQNRLTREIPLSCVSVFRALMTIAGKFSTYRWTLLVVSYTHTCRFDVENLLAF